MSIRVQLPNVLVKLADGHRTLEASGATVGDAVSDIARQFPALAPRLRDERGEPYEFVTFYLNDEDIRLNGGFGQAVRAGDELTIVPAVAGG
jgi:molybdopterin synthase sulfur carrier subunit